MESKLFILSTDIKTKKKLNKVALVLNNHESIHQWSVDMEDIDKVLRIETNENIQETDIIQLIKDQGIHAQDLDK